MKAIREFTKEDFESQLKWHPPPLLDTGGDTINHHFHPEELLNHPEEAEDDPERQDDSG